MFSTPGAFPYFMSLAAFRISSLERGSVFISSTSLLSSNPLAWCSGSALLRTSLKYSFHLSLMSDSLERFTSSLLLTALRFFGWSLHKCLVTSYRYTHFMLPVWDAFSAFFAKTSVHMRLSLLIPFLFYFFTLIAVILTYPFFFLFQILQH